MMLETVDIRLEYLLDRILRYMSLHCRKLIAATQRKCSFVLCHQSVEFSIIGLVDDVVRNLKVLFAAGILLVKE